MGYSPIAHVLNRHPLRLGCPVLRHELTDASRRMTLDPAQDVVDILVGIEPVKATCRHETLQHSKALCTFNVTGIAYRILPSANSRNPRSAKLLPSGTFGSVRNSFRSARRLLA